MCRHRDARRRCEDRPNLPQSLHETPLLHLRGGGCGDILNHRVRRAYSALLSVRTFSGIVADWSAPLVLSLPTLGLVHLATLISKIRVSLNFFQRVCNQEYSRWRRFLGRAIGRELLVVLGPKFCGFVPGAGYVSLLLNLLVAPLRRVGLRVVNGCGPMVDLPLLASQIPYLA